MTLDLSSMTVASIREGLAARRFSAVELAESGKTRNCVVGPFVVDDDDRKAGRPRGLVLGIFHSKGLCRGEPAGPGSLIQESLK